jgi:hypothetical protein
MTDDTEIHDLGDQVRIRVLFEALDVDDETWIAVDPTDVVLKIKEPTLGTETEVTVVQDDTGSYHYDLDLTAPGLWRWRWVGTGDAVAADEGKLLVRQSAFSNP